MFSDPSGLAFADDGTIFVADRQAFGTGGLIAVNSDTGEQRKLSASSVATRPMGVAMASNGDVIVAYLNAGDGLGAIARVDPGNGAHQFLAPLTTFVTPADVVVDSTGAVLVADADIQGFDSRIRRIDTAGVVTDPIVNEPPGAIYFGLAIAQNGDLFAVSHGNGPGNKRLVRLRLGLPTSFPVSDDGLILAPFGVAVEPTGRVIVIDAVSGVIRIDPSSGAQEVVSSGGSFVQPLGIVVA